MSDESQELRDWLHLCADSAYWYYTYKRWALWQLAKAWIDMPSFMLVCCVLLVGLLFGFACWKPWFAAGLSGFGAFLWNYVL